MECYVLLLLFLVAKGAEESQSPALKLDDQQYHKMTDDEGLHDVDLWLTDADLQSSEAYNPDEENRYHLYTRMNPSVSQPILYGDVSSVRRSLFSPHRPTAVVIHGWQSGPTSDLFAVVVPAFLAARDMNVITVDWSAGADTLYGRAVLNTVTSGKSVARFIRWLNSETGASVANYHIVGHSLGGQQAGVVGRHLDGMAPYVTALDPALPGWLNNNDTFRSTDGIYTEVIHTNGGFLGFKTPLGDVDFYPNGGSNMPGCSTLSCNHFRSYYYFAESLASGGFSGTLCRSYEDALDGKCYSTYRLKMGGIYPKIGQRGVYYLETNAEPPFSKDKKWSCKNLSSIKTLCKVPT